MKNSAKIMLGLTVLGAAAAGFGLKDSRARHAPTPPRTVLTTRGDIAVQVEETGTIEPVNRIDVKSKVAGRILSTPIQEGQYVRAGQLIATVDRTLLDPQIAQTQAQLDQAQARLDQTVAAYRLQVVQTRMAIAQAQAGVETARTHLAAIAAGARPQEVAQQQQAVQRARSPWTMPSVPSGVTWPCWQKGSSRSLRPTRPRSPWTPPAATWPPHSRRCR